MSDTHATDTDEIEQIDELLTRLRDVEQKILDQENELEQLSNRIDELTESDTDRATSDHATADNGYDAYDTAVLDVLVEGNAYSPVNIRNLYLSYTRISNTTTAKERAKNLVRRAEFTDTRNGLIYNGDGL